MTHDELLYQIDLELRSSHWDGWHEGARALRAIVELHSGEGINNRCVSCAHGNKCETIQLIEKELL